MNIEEKEHNLAKRTLAWRNRLNELRGEAAQLKAALEEVCIVLERTQIDDNLKPLVAKLPVEEDAVLEPGTKRGAHAKGQERADGGTFKKKEG